MSTQSDELRPVVKAARERFCNAQWFAGQVKDAEESKARAERDVARYQRQVADYEWEKRSAMHALDFIATEEDLTEDQTRAALPDERLTWYNPNDTTSVMEQLKKYRADKRQEWRERNQHW